ncbi:MAG: hypothetical protein LQ337_005551 [Flavoplaca oasis]|nr:MAG: hypothetical protein LQ337_005551 [Flavoplaca oasis]
MCDEKNFQKWREYFDTIKENDAKRHKKFEQFLDSNARLLNEKTKLEARCGPSMKADEVAGNERLQPRNVAQRQERPVKEGRPFVVVLIDADADVYMFRAQFLNKKEEGGQKAADELLHRIKAHLESLDMDISYTDIVVRAYASFGGLARACVIKAGMKETASFGRFANGFNGRGALFDFVDVGCGKERADHKIKGKRSHHDSWISND